MFGLWNVRVFWVVLVRVQQNEDALENIQDAIAVCLQVRADLGLPLTMETRRV